MTLKAHPRTPWRSEFNEAYATDRVDAFFQALFATVESEVEQIRQQIVGDRPIAGAPNDNVPDLYVKVAKEFRLQMTARQHFLCTNAYRTRLYTKVLRRAGELMEEADPVRLFQFLSNKQCIYSNACLIIECEETDAFGPSGSRHRSCAEAQFAKAIIRHCLHCCV